jgi:hypothetical protein
MVILMKKLIKIETWNILWGVFFFIKNRKVCLSLKKKEKDRYSMNNERAPIIENTKFAEFGPTNRTSLRRGPEHDYDGEPDLPSVRAHASAQPPLLRPINNNGVLKRNFPDMQRRRNLSIDFSHPILEEKQEHSVVSRAQAGSYK